MNISEILHGINFKIQGGNLYRIEHDFGSLQISVSMHGIIRIDGFTTKEKHVVTGHLRRCEDEWLTKVSTRGKRRELSSLEWTEVNAPEEEISLISNTSLCTLILRHLVSCHRTELCSYEEEARLFSAEFKKAALKQKDIRMASERESILRTHRLMTNYEVERLLKSLKGKALGEGSYSYITLKSIQGNITVGCEGTSSRVSWFKNGERVSQKSLVCSLASNAVVVLPCT